VLVHKVDIFH